MFVRYTPGFKRVCEGKRTRSTRVLPLGCLSKHREGVELAEIGEMVAAGADILVCGSSSLFNKAGSLAENMKKTQQAAQEGLAGRS